MSTLKERLKRNREEWLLRAVEMLDAKVMRPVELAAPKHVWVSVGWPCGSRGKGKAIGQCWPRINSKDKSGHIFISPELDDSKRVLDVLLHELLHDVVGCEHGHKKPFADAAKKVGLVKPWTATTASPELLEVLKDMHAKLGDYPHAALTGNGGLKKQTTRMRKYQCPDCEQIIRAATDDLEASCTPCGTPFERSE